MPRGGVRRDTTRPSHRVAIGLLLLCLACLALANCAGPSAGRFGNKYGVRPSPKVIADGEPVPKGGGRDMTGKPYVVGGQTYVPETGPGYVRKGYASWYGTAFHGRLTANGEIFDKDSIAAAHPTLPLPSYVRVTNLEDKRSMIVRVNDRGPYERSRLIDLSERAATALAFHRKGTTHVRIEYIGRASLRGSDDRKLLATLTTDGSPARIGGRATMLAALDEGAFARPAAPAGREQTALTGSASPAPPPAPGEKTAARLSAETPIDPGSRTALVASAGDPDVGSSRPARIAEADLAAEPPPRQPAELSGIY